MRSCPVDVALYRRVVRQKNRRRAGVGPTSIEWRKGTLIGSGSFGKVYRGFNATTGALLPLASVVCIFEALRVLFRCFSERPRDGGNFFYTKAHRT